MMECQNHCSNQALPHLADFVQQEPSRQSLVVCDAGSGYLSPANDVMLTPEKSEPLSPQQRIVRSLERERDKVGRIFSGSAADGLMISACVHGDSHRLFNIAVMNPKSACNASCVTRRHQDNISILCLERCEVHVHGRHLHPMSTDSRHISLSNIEFGGDESHGFYNSLIRSPAVTRAVAKAGILVVSPVFIHVASNYTFRKRANSETNTSLCLPGPSCAQVWLLCCNNLAQRTDSQRKCFASPRGLLTPILCYY